MHLKKFISRMKKYLFLISLLTIFCFLEVFSQKKQTSTQKKKTEEKNEPKTNLTPAEIAEYKKQAEGLIKFLEGTFNFLGNEKSSTKEKDVIVTNSYLKIFRDEKVQIEDDLDEKRETILSKNAPAYLKDIDFFFKKVKFEFRIEEISHFVTQENQTAFKVTLQRHLQGITINQDTVNTTKVRYIEINLDQEKKELKIASIYTTQLNEFAELKKWWNALPVDWNVFLLKFVTIQDSITFPQLKSVVSMTELDVSGQNISDLEPLMRFSDLKKLNISNTKVSSLTPLRNFTKLEIFNCANTSVSDLSPLRYCFDLKELTANSSQIQDWKIAANFLKLEKLYLEKTPTSDISIFQYLTNLKDLRINGTNVVDISVLKNVKNLEFFKISDTQIENLEVLQFFENLEMFYCDNTPAKNFEALKNCKKLKALFCNKTKINDLSSLEKLPVLERIYCNYSQISREKATQFMSQKPLCLVIYDAESQKNWWKNLPQEWKNVFRNYKKIDEPATAEQLQEVMNLTVINISNQKNIKTIEPLRKLLLIKELYCSNTGIDSLSALKDLVDLKILECNNTNVQSLESLKSLRNLEKINISKTKINNLTALNGKNSLKILFCDSISVSQENIEKFIDENLDYVVIYQSFALSEWWKNLPQEWKNYFSQVVKIDAKPSTEQLHSVARIEEISLTESSEIKDLTPLQKLRRLKILRFPNTRISNLQPLSLMSNLEKLDCAGNAISDLSALKNLKKLNELNCENTAVENLESLDALRQLENLNIAGTKVGNLKKIKNLTELTHLNFSNTSVLFLKPISDFKKLKVLKCYHTWVWKMFVEKFEKKHPNCEVIFY